MKKIENLKLKELSQIKGGKRTVSKIDVDGDGKWDIKFVTNSRTGKTKYKARV